VVESSDLERVNAFDDDDDDVILGLHTEREISFFQNLKSLVISYIYIYSVIESSNFEKSSRTLIYSQRCPVIY